MGIIWYDTPAGKRKLTKAWWQEEAATLHMGVAGTIQALREDQAHNEKRNIHHLRLYGNLDILGLSPFDYSKLAEGYENHVTYNVCESAVDTVHADVTAQKNKPMFLTDQGDWKQRRQAEGLNQFVVGQFYHAHVTDDIAPDTCHDALVLGTGAVKIYADNNKPVAERVFINEIIVDDIEGRMRKPRQLFQQSCFPRESVRAAVNQWHQDNPKKLKECDELVTKARVAGLDNGLSETIADQIELFEAWHLPSSPGAEDGRHAICTEDGTLLDEQWDDDDFPFVFLRYKNRRLGFWGKGIPEILSGSQIAINELLWKIHQSLKLAGPKVFVRPGSNLNMAQLDNEIWGIIECLEPPHMAVFEAVPPDLFRQLHDEIQNSYSLVGVSMLAAASQLPEGLTRPSGKALRIYSDKKSQRFVKFAQAYEQFHLDLADKFIELTRKLQKDKKQPYEVLVPKDDGTAKLLKWSDVDLDRDKYIMQAYPTSFLSSTPSSRVKDVEELVAVAPQLEPYVLKLLDFPDLKSVTNLESSALELAQMIIEENMDGEYTPPEPLMNLDLTLRLANAYYQRARLNNAPTKTLENLRQFMVAVQDMMSQAKPPAPPMAPPPGVVAPAPQLIPQGMTPMPPAGMPPMPPVGMPPQGPMPQ